jgi:predicted nucleic acid-binding protein
LTVYLDSSFVVSLYLTDRHSPDSRQRVVGTSHIWFTPLHQAEWAHAIAQHVFRRTLSPTESQQIYEHLKDDQAAGLWAEVEIPENAFRVCADLGRRYAPKIGIRTLDTLHVACAFELKADQFWTFDDRQAKLAKAVGLKLS